MFSGALPFEQSVACFVCSPGCVLLLFSVVKLNTDLKLPVSAITVGIGETNIPTDDTTVMVSLGRTQGGATLSNRSNVSIIIMAHDFVAGLLSFNQTSYFVNEGM